jgi:cysteine synthase A
MIYENAAELVGGTPLLRLKRLEEKYSLKAKLYAKLEYFNPTGSIKDRAAKGMIDGAIKRGLITKNTTVIEPTSGNTGIGIASICSSLGIRSVIVMPSNMSRERQLFIKAYGAEVVLTDASLGMKGAIAKAEELKASIEDSFIPSQFDNIDNAEAHYNTTAPEIYEDLDGKVDYVVAGIGTGGTIMGISRYMKERSENIKIIGVEPAASPLITEGHAGPHKLQGIGANFIPSIFDPAMTDRIITATAEDSYALAREMGCTLGIGVGISSGAALFAAIEVARCDEASGKTVVAICPDGIDRYLSTDLFK